jgi:hypothetical protein
VLDQQISLIEADAESLVKGLSFEEANWSPSPSQWSNAQCLYHVSVSARLYLTSIDPCIAKGWKNGMHGRSVRLERLWTVACPGG